jgi:hypothetical protein
MPLTIDDFRTVQRPPDDDIRRNNAKYWELRARTIEMRVAQMRAEDYLDEESEWELRLRIAKTLEPRTPTLRYPMSILRKR